MLWSVGSSELERRGGESGVGCTSKRAASGRLRENHSVAAAVSLSHSICLLDG